MGSITIMTIVVVAILGVTIFGSVWLGYSACLKKYKLELAQGKHDIELCEELNNKKQKTAKDKIISYVLTSIILFALLGLFIAGIISKTKNDSFSVNGNTTLVIKSGSMSGFYDNALADKYEELGYDKKLQFSYGDICFFEKPSKELKVGEVYAYSYNDIIITHRLIGTQVVKDVDGNILQTYYVFRGDNNPSIDEYVTSDKILYHYTGNKIPSIGDLILFAQSYLGIWCIICVIGVIISSDIVLNKIQKLNNQRYEELGGVINE